MDGKVLKFIWAAVLVAVLLAPWAARPASAGELKNHKGNYTEIFYADDSVLRKLDRRISMRWLKRVSELSDISSMSMPGVVAGKLDVVRLNVEDILDMYPRKALVGFNVMVSEGDVREALKKFGNKKSYRAFYSKRDKRIYLAAESANTNIIAHELAHAVVDMELGPAVPETVHEILARYVDAHLYD